MIKIPIAEFKQRAEKLKQWMSDNEVDACFIYGDEYRRENLRYMSNFWPIFERGAIIIPQKGEPIVLGAPEGEVFCREMSAWKDIRLVPEFACVTVPEDIEYPFANYTTFMNVFTEIRENYQLKRLGVIGIDAMPKYLYENIVRSAGEAEIIDANSILNFMRLVKSDNEIKCIRKAAEIADYAYTELMKAAVPGVTELELSGIATGEAMKQGAEYVPFCLVSSGKRVDTIIGRATNKIIDDGDMVMAALAVQYEGYIASFGFPFVVGKTSTDQKQLITYLIEAFESAIIHLKPETPQNMLVSSVKDYFRGKGLEKYDLYPPLHGCGLSEAESPYPNESVTEVFLKNMTVNTDISLFGHPFGSNRIEASFIVTEDGYESLSELIKKLTDSWKAGKEFTEVI